MGNMSSSTVTTSSSSSSVDSVISSADIVVFQDAYCPYCQDAVRSLTAAGKEFSVIDASREQRSQLYSLTKVSSVPSIWVKGKFVGGCNDGPESWMGIKKLLKNGKLDELLSK